MPAPLYFKRLNSDASKPMAILIHGLFGSGENLTSLGKSLCGTYQVILVDALNHGLSPRSKQMDYMTQSHALVALINQLELDSVTLIGHSMGGKIAMGCALLHPEKVNALIVADIAPVRYPRSHDPVFQALLSVNLDTLSSRKQTTQSLDQRLSIPGVAPFLTRSLYQNGLQWDWRFDLTYLYDNYNAILDWPFDKQHYLGPVLFIKGMKSDYLKSDYQTQVIEQFPRAQLKAIADTGHWLHAEKPMIFNRIVANFLLSNG